MNKNNAFAVKIIVVKRMEKETTGKDIYALSVVMYLKVKDGLIHSTKSCG